MKKLGFTLAEIIVALGIIGVVAAITSPIINNIIPDKDKVQVIKVHKLLTDINKEFLSDSSLYYKEPRDPDEPVLHGFDQLGPALRDKYLSPNPNFMWYQGQSKYLALLADYMKTESINITENSNIGSFVTVDGVEWVFDGFSFYIDLDDESDSMNCSYNSNSCPRPDRFNFIIDPETGVVSGNDPLTRAYLANPDNLSDKKADYKTAKANGSS